MRVRFVILTTWFSCIAIGCTAHSDHAFERSLLLETDRQWATAAASGDVDRVLTYWADDAINFFPGAPVLKGKLAIGKLVKENRARPGFSLTWEPVLAAVSRSGDLGYTLGPFQLSVHDPEGNAVIRRGNYVCIWKKQTEGEWKCVVESTIFGP